MFGRVDALDNSYTLKILRDYIPATMNDYAALAS